MTALRETLTATADTTRGKTDPFRRLMVTNDETEDHPKGTQAENAEDPQATSLDQETPTKTYIETWVDERFKRSSETFMELIFIAMEDKLSGAIKFPMTDLVDKQPAESDM